LGDTHAQAVQLAMDRRGRERELTSVLLAGLVPAPLTHEQLALGFTRLLASVEARVLYQSAWRMFGSQQRVCCSESESQMNSFESTTID